MVPELKDTHVIILAGGLGTRLQPVISDRPKVLAPIGDKTILDHTIHDLLRWGFRDITLSVGYMKEKIREHIENQLLPKDVTIKFSEEENPLGTGGAIKKAIADSLCGTALILNGDTFFPIDYHRFMRQHAEHNADMSIGLRQIEDTSQSGTVLTDKNDRIISFREKTGEKKSGAINGGIYMCGRDIFDKFDLPEAFSIEKDFFEKHISKIKAHGFLFPDYFIDIGTPDNYAKAQDDLKSGRAFY